MNMNACMNECLHALRLPGLSAARRAEVPSTAC